MSSSSERTLQLCGLATARGQSMYFEGGQAEPPSGRDARRPACSGESGAWTGTELMNEDRSLHCVNAIVRRA